MYMYIWCLIYHLSTSLDSFSQHILPSENLVLKDAPKHEIHSTNNCNCISDGMVAHNEVRACKMSEAWGTDLAFIGAIRTIPAKIKSI